MDRYALWVVDSGEPKELLWNGGPDTHRKGQFSRRKGRPIVKYREYCPCAMAMRPFVKLLWPLTDTGNWEWEWSTWPVKTSLLQQSQKVGINNLHIVLLGDIFTVVYWANGVVTGWRGHRWKSSSVTCSCPHRRSTSLLGSCRWVVVGGSTDTTMRRAAGSSVCLARRSTASHSPSPHTDTHARMHAHSVLMLHRSTMQADVAYCYRQSSLSVSLSRLWAPQKPLNRLRCCWGGGLGWAQGIMLRS